MSDKGYEDENGDADALTKEEEAKCWEASARKEVAFEESFMFSAPRNVQAVAISMRGSQSWGYFGIICSTIVIAPIFIDFVPNLDRIDRPKKRF